MTSRYEISWTEQVEETQERSCWARLFRRPAKQARVWKKRSISFLSLTPTQLAVLRGEGGEVEREAHDLLLRIMAPDTGMIYLLELIEVEHELKNFTVPRGDAGK